MVIVNPRGGMTAPVPAPTPRYRGCPMPGPPVAATGCGGAVQPRGARRAVQPRSARRGGAAGQQRWDIGVVRAAAMGHWCRCGYGERLAEAGLRGRMGFEAWMWPGQAGSEAWMGP